MSDGTVKIDTSLNTEGVKKDLQTIEKQVNNTSKEITKSMDNAETSVKKMGKAFSGVDFTKIKSQMDNISKSIENTNAKIDVQKTKLTGLKTAYESATTPKQKNKLQEQILSTESTIISLEGKLNTLGTRMSNLNSKMDVSKSMDAMADLDGEFKTASISIGNSIDKIEKKTKTMNTSIGKEISNAGDIVSKVGDKISSTGDKLTTRVTAPLAGVAIAGAKVGLDFDSAMSRVKAISGATGNEFDKLKGQALQLGKDTAFSARHNWHTTKKLVA